MTAATFTRVEVAEKLGISEARVRQLLAVVSERIDDATADNRITEAGFDAIVSYREMGRAAWLNAHPVAPETTQAPAHQPEPQPAVHEMADRPDRELVGQAQATQPAFTPVTDVAIAPAHPVPHFTVIAGGLSTAAIPAIPQQSPVMGLGDVGGQILASNASTQSAAAAITQMMDALMIRMQVGMDANHAQSQIGTQEEEELATKLAEFRAVVAEYDRQSRVTSIRENLRADRVGKLVSEMTQVAGRAGFQLSVQSQSAG